ncbi:unnamed protein product [Cylicocyclus nassatus]|uniref:Uncharacterized protein n=1 Tax=Cylicocyclus nassatus TaxID=53992 RepID=A0AA36MDN7_CYLNA|nr:unnamed protein product [Cylicocyclus nassatus]
MPRRQSIAEEIERLYGRRPQPPYSLGNRDGEEGPQLEAAQRQQRSWSALGEPRANVQEVLKRIPKRVESEGRSSQLNSGTKQSPKEAGCPADKALLRKLSASTDDVLSRLTRLETEMARKDPSSKPLSGSRGAGVPWASRGPTSRRCSRGFPKESKAKVLAYDYAPAISGEPPEIVWRQCEQIRLGHGKEDL